MDYRKALLSTKESRDTAAAIIRKEQEAKEALKLAEEARIFKEREAKNILRKLPRDIRDIIWRLLLRRHGTILPGYVHWVQYTDRKAGDHYYVLESRNCKAYQYQWNELPQQNKHDWSNGRSWCSYEPSYMDNRTNTLTLTIPTEPTYNQTELIDRGHKSLPFTYNNDYGTQVGCDVVRRGNDGEAGAQVINRVEVHLPGFEAIFMLRVCKQIYEECSQVLYSENTFAFITGSGRPLNSRHAHEPDELSHYLRQIPGYLRQTRSQFSKSLDMLFSRIIDEHYRNVPGFRPKFVARDPMLDFFNRIGRINTSLLTKIEIEGCMKTLYNFEPDEDMENVEIKPFALGFAQILPIFTTVLKNTCPNLRVLTLHMEDKKSDRERYLWDWDPYNNAAKTDDERIDKVVERVVSGLDSLEALNLGGYKSFMMPECRTNWEYEDEWGGSVRWMKIVRDRTEERGRETAAKKLEARLAKLAMDS
ncbi:hypothetical protein BDZ45DRAFT_739770 [Acephala macrosclerotiorum]|nr:hypothetical protein BDZ45DRAFT_739770 [Acephala macrosclerotiorum]